MTRLFRNCLVSLCIFVLVLSNFGAAQAARGTPTSAEFGIGATIYPEGPYLVQALEMASNLDLDWIMVPVSWAASQPAPGQSPQFAALDPVMELAAARSIAVLVSLNDAPEWALTQRGPDPSFAAQMVANLTQRYSGTIQAVELFPGANTREGWGAAPNAQAYFHLFQMVSGQLQNGNAPVLLVAAGLRPVAASAQGQDISDTRFLEELYQLGASSIMPVISMQFLTLNGAPVSYPESGEVHVLRHYEQIRRIMSENGHHSGLIWVTRLSPPSGKIGVPDSAPKDLNEQSNWMSLAYIQLRAQLYIGVTIGQSLNPEPGGMGVGVPSLISDSGVYHPFYSVLHEMISLNRTGSVSIRPGKPKEGSLAKKRP
jgi:hypothetical protein